MKISIVIICDKIRISKLHRLVTSMLPSIHAYKPEILLLHESNHQQSAPKLPAEIRYINIPENRGIPYNRNQGIKQSHGDVVVFIDDDCWVHRAWLGELIEPLKDEEVMAVTSGTKIPKSNFLGDCISALGFPGGGSLGFEKVWKVSKGLTNHLAVGNCALRREVFDRIGLFDESLKKGAEDAELSHRLEKVGIPIIYQSGAYAFHEARTTLPSFISWQLRRGRANYHFKRKVGMVGSFVKLRWWSTRNIINHNITNIKLPVILSLLGTSFILQQAGYLVESINSFKRRPR
jgi:GT2 family glycosyltransferase